MAFSVEPVGVFFAFYDPDWFACLDGVVEFGVSVEGAFDSGDAVFPFAGFGVEGLLPELFVGCADDPVSGCAVSVLVQVGDGLLGCVWLFGVVDVCPCEVEGGEDVVCVASCVAVEDDGLCGASVDGE